MVCNESVPPKDQHPTLPLPSCFPFLMSSLGLIPLRNLASVTMGFLPAVYCNMPSRTHELADTTQGRCEST